MELSAEAESIIAIKELCAVPGETRGSRSRKSANACSVTSGREINDVSRKMKFYQ